MHRAHGPDRAPTQLPIPSAGNLVRLMLPVAAVALGAFLAFGPYLHTTRLMKAVLLTAPALTSLVALKVIDSFSARAPAPKQEPVAPVVEKPASLELKTGAFSLPKRLDYYQTYMTGSDLRDLKKLGKKLALDLSNAPDDKRASLEQEIRANAKAIGAAKEAVDQLRTHSPPQGQITLSEMFTKDLTRDNNSTWFQEETSGTDATPSWQLQLDKEKQGVAVQQMVEQLHGQYKFSLDDITRLSWVWHQGPFADILDRLMLDFPDTVPLQYSISHPLGNTQQHVYKILYKGSELTAMETQSVYKVAPADDVSNEDRTVYVLANMRFDFKTGDAVASYKTARTEGGLTFDRP